MADIIIGIDPGLTGAVCFMRPSGKFLSVCDMPVMAKGKGKSRVKSQVNPIALASLLQNELMGKDRHGRPSSRMLTGIVYMERVSSMPGQGVASVFSLGDTFGCLRGVIGALGIPIEIIMPQSWKKHFKLPSDKEVCRAKAIELFPSAPLDRKKDHNRSEAILIAAYGCHMEKVN